MRYLLAIIFITLFFCASAQGFRSRFYLPNDSNNLARAIFEINPGSYFAAGFSDRLTIMGLDSIGQPIWVKKYGTNKYTYLPNIFIRRSFYMQGNYIYHACCVRDSNNKQIGALLKFDLNGDTLWQKFFRDTAEGDDVIPQMVTGSVDGGFLITGFFQKWSPNGYNVCLLIKTDANGNELWRKKLSKTTPNVSDGKAILQDSATGRIVIAGYQYGLGAPIHDHVLILDSLGNIIARRSYTGLGGGVAYDLLQTKDKKIIVVGLQYDQQTIGTLNYMQGYVVKFDVNTPFNPVPIWKIQLNQITAVNFSACLRELENGEILVGGTFDTSSLNFGPRNVLIRFTTIDSTGLVKSNRYHNYQYSTDTFNNHNLRLASLEIGSNGSWLAAIETVNNPKPNPFFFVKYDSSGCDSTLAYCKVMAEVGVEELQNFSADIKLYPNPAQTGFYLHYNTQNADVLFIEIKDLPGKTVYAKRTKIGENEIYIPVENFSNGMYFITAKQNGHIIYKAKVVKQN